MSTLESGIPLALYVHFPWCVRKCPYCDFNSHPLKGDVPQTEYVAQLLADLEIDSAFVRDRRVSSIFFGGGTPSLFSGASIARVMRGIAERVELDPNVEVTLEANPGTIDENHFAGYAHAGVNRLSIGAQSFDPQSLVRLGRIHRVDEIDRAVRVARAAGIERINLDLMHGLPKQTQTGALEDLRLAIGLDVEHISWYQLTLEPRTPFAANPPPLPDEDELAHIEAAGLQLLESSGFNRYEISAFTRNRPARHNVNYWSFGDYLGIGAGAHGKLSFAQGNGEISIVRTEKPKAPERYLKTPAAMLSQRAEVAVAARAGEFMLNALRLSEGVDARIFESRTGLSVTSIAPIWQQQIELELMRREVIAVTDLGRRYLDSVVAAFL